uniref:Reverse transcriptase domain-containing protein n=1 Tax=Tanacetum cinerariifolium TaxID=118510 RepID=A0A699H5X5_TANCI|nr:hypothetical protein [Tanacetum cinerariifolium]
MVKNELKNEMKTSIQTSLSNQTNEIKNMMASLLQINTAYTSGSGTLPGNTIANPKGELNAITTRSGLVTEGPTVPNHPKSINPEEDECVKETYTNPDLAEYTIKVPPPPVQKPKPPIQSNFVLHTRDSLLSHIPYPSRMMKQKQQEKDDIQIQKFWNMFKQLHLNITLTEALSLMPKYQKMLKSLLSNKEKLQELANTPLNENCSAVILKKLSKKLGDPGKFLIPCSFSLPDLIPTRMTLELANCAICTPDGIARDVFVPVGRPFLRTARALIDVHVEEMILCDGDERLTLNMKHDTASYSNHPHRDSVNLINIFNIPSEDCLEDLVSNKQSGNPTFSLHKEIASLKVTHELHDSKGCTFLSEELADIDSFNDIHPYFDDDPLSGSTTYSANSLLEEFTDELALITYPPDSDDNYQPDLPCDILSKYDSFNSQDFSRDDDFPSPNNEDKVFNPGILIHEKSVTIITRVTQEKKLAVSYASLLFEDFDPPFYELLVFKEVPNLMRLLLFSSENEEKVFKPGIYTFKKLSSILGFMKILANGLHYLKSSLFPLFNLGITLKNTKKRTKSDQKPNKNGKRDEARKSQMQLQWIKEVKLKKTQKKGRKCKVYQSYKKKEKNKGQFCNYMKVTKEGSILPRFHSCKDMDCICN